MWAIVFPWHGSFRFSNNKFCNPTHGIGLLSFGSGSRVWFTGNDFAGNDIQTQCTGSKKEGSDSPARASKALGEISFLANKRLASLSIQEGYSSIEISGMNRIDRLAVDLIIEGEEDRRTSIYLGPRERIDPKFFNCLQHRSLFLDMRRLAAINQDNPQLTVLDRKLERIEYFLSKERGSPSIFDLGIWIQYWQDRILYGLRCWSSDFYRSWLRPFLCLFIGYLAINAVPFFLIESFSISHWKDLTLRPITELATYEASLKQILGMVEYETLSDADKRNLKLAGWAETVWIAMWSFPFAKAIRR